MQALPVQAGEACVFELAEENSQNEECRCFGSCIRDPCLGNTVIQLVWWLCALRVGEKV